MEGPVFSEFPPQCGGQGHDPILMSLAATDEQLVLWPVDVVNGQGEALAQAESADVDEFDGRAVAAQADVGEKIAHLLSGEDWRKGVVIFDPKLGEDAPVGVAEQIDEEQADGSPGLTEGFGLPVFLEFDEEEVVAELGLSEQCGIASEVFVEQPHLTVVGMAGAIGVVAKGQRLGQSGHGIEGMLIVDRVGELPSRGSDRGDVS